MNSSPDITPHTVMTDAVLVRQSSRRTKGWQMRK